MDLPFWRQIVLFVLKISTFADNFLKPVNLLLSLDGVLESMRGKLIVFLFFMLAGLIGCTKRVSEIGSTLFTNNVFNIAYIDSVSLKVSTVKTDSMVTSNAIRLLVGYHEDEKLGSVTAKSIFQVGLTKPIRFDRHTTSYVALRLFLKRDRYSYYDTTSTQTISVHRLSKGIKLNKGFLYNTTKFSVDSTPLGTLTFLPRPHHPDSLEIALPDELGRQLMTMAQENDIRLSSNNEFIKFFKGLVLIPDSTSSRNMIGFKLKPEMRLYYHDLSAATTKDKHVSFEVGTNVYFNNVYANRAGTQLSSLQKKNESISSTFTQHEAYFQSGAGLVIRVEMPYLRNLLFNDRNFLCTRAVLEFVPIKEFESQSSLPPILSVFIADGLNQLLSNFPHGGILIKDVESGQNTRYATDITDFVNSQIQTNAFNNNALLISLDDNQFRSSVNRLYIGDPKYQYGMKIKIYYITLSN